MAALICTQCGPYCRELCMLPCRVMRSLGNCVQGVNAPAMLAYTVAVVATNVVPMYYTWQTQYQYSTPDTLFTETQRSSVCHDAMQWLWINSAFCALHIIAALYIACRVNARSPMELAAMTAIDPSKQQCCRCSDCCYREGDNTISSTTQRLQRVTCYDPIFAIYIFIMAGFIYWIVYGTQRILPDLNTAETNGVPCPSLQFPAVYESLRWAFYFFFFAGITFAFSLCCLRGRRNRLAQQQNSPVAAGSARPNGVAVATATHNSGPYPLPR